MRIGMEMVEAAAIVHQKMTGIDCQKVCLLYF